MLNIRDLGIDNASLGDKLLLVEVVPAYEYKDKQRTDNITGYRYVVCLAAEISSTGTYHIHIFLDSTSPMRFSTGSISARKESGRARTRRSSHWIPAMPSGVGTSISSGRIFASPPSARPFGK